MSWLACQGDGRVCGRSQEQRLWWSVTETQATLHTGQAFSQPCFSSQKLHDTCYTLHATCYMHGKCFFITCSTNDRLNDEHEIVKAGERTPFPTSSLHFRKCQPWDWDGRIKPGKLRKVLKLRTPSSSSYPQSTAYRTCPSKFRAKWILEPAGFPDDWGCVRGSQL